nr:hypothetical protein DM860_003145 [Ipomoea batatas]
MISSSNGSHSNRISFYTAEHFVFCTKVEEMDKVYEELDEVKAEIEKLRDECRAKTELCGSLKKAHVELAAKLQEARLEIERQTKELCVKSKEIFEVRQLYEEIKSILHEKESFLQSLSSANQKLRVDYCEKIGKLEGENKELVLALDEATTKIQELERKVCASDKEINALKETLSVRKEKGVEAQLNVQASRELKEANEVIQKLEEDNRIAQDQLKWKNEHFTHLEEAHRRLHDNFQTSKAEWGKEKSELLEEISSLQTSLDSQIRISQDLETQLRLCNQALAHEESRRKVLEVEVSDFKSRCDDILLECQETKSKLEHLTFKRDEEIGELRNLLRTKETLFKEMKFRASQLEQEKLDLCASLKELQDTKLNDAAASSSLKKLQTRFNSLEQLHSKYSLQYKEKEAKLSSEIEKLTEGVKECMSELKVKSKRIEKLEKELEGCHYSMYAQNEETSILMLVLQSEFPVARKQLSAGIAELELHNKEKDNKIVLLKEQLESIDIAHNKVCADLKEKCEETMALEAEIKRYKEMAEELAEYKLRTTKEMLQMENALQESKGASEALEKANLDLAKRTSELMDSKLEAEKWKSVAEHLKADLKKNQLAYEKENESLCGIVKEKDSKITDMQLKISELELVAIARAEAVEALKKENIQYFEVVEDKDGNIKDLQHEITQLKQELANSELKNEHAKSDALLMFEKEKQNLLMILKVRDERIHDLMEQAKVLEKNLETAETVVKEKENLLNETLEKAESSKILEVESKNKVIAELDMKVSDLLQKLEFHEKSLLNSNKKVEELDTMLEASKVELEELKSQFGMEQMRLEGRNEELESQKNDLLHEIQKLSHDRDSLLLQLDGMCTRFDKSLDEDDELAKILGKMLKHSEGKSDLDINHIMGDDNYTCGTVKTTLLLARKGLDQQMDERVPLKELNY